MTASEPPRAQAPVPWYNRPRTRRVLVALGLFALVCVVVYEFLATAPVRGAMTTLSRIVALANASEPDLERIRSYCSSRYLANHPLAIAPEGGLIGLPRSINKNFRAWHAEGAILVFPSSRDGNGPVYRFVREAGDWRYDGVVGMLDSRGRLIPLTGDEPVSGVFPPAAKAITPPAVGFTPLPCLIAFQADTPPPRLRLIVETDAGGDPDDEQSLVRFLLYANEWDLEGIIANRIHARDGENLSPERTGLGIVRALIDAYGVCHAHLKEHDPRYPDAARLRSLTVPGRDDSDEAVRLLIEAIDRDDPRPVWYLNWGTINGSEQSALLRALDQVLRERGADAYSRFKSRFFLASDDQFGTHTLEVDPPFPLWIDTFRPEWREQGGRWYWRFSTITARAGGFDIERDVRRDHGPLGALYPTNTTHPQKEGDSMTFLYLIPNGLNAPEHPTWGGWAGRYGPNEKTPGKPYYHANVLDDWRGTKSRDNSLARWAVALQNDFRARLDWCVQSPSRANHPPIVRVEGARDRTVRPGQSVTLDAAATRDPDQDEINYEWFFYPEAGTYPGPTPAIADPNSARPRLKIPVDAGGCSLHLILAATDRGAPPLTRYARIVLDVRKD